jgi:hypothetical protein
MLGLIVCQAPTVPIEEQRQLHHQALLNGQRTEVVDK